MKYDFELDLKSRNSLSLLIERVKSNSTVLEFGPANGRMTKYLKEKLNCKVYAVEIDEKAAKDVSHYTEKTVVDNIENYNWKQEVKNIKFDFIIFADVLEHLTDPKKVLESVGPFLKDRGSILISIPNIAHNAITLGLLRNEFNYSPTGLLDETHLRFYTQKTFDSLIETIGYHKVYETAVYMSPKDTEFAIDYDDVPDEVGMHLSKLPWGEMYQLIYEIKKVKVDLVSDFLNEYKTYSKYYTQLFIDNNQGFCEESSIKYFVDISKDIQSFSFDLSSFKNITNLRFDPLNESCVLEIDEIILVRQDNSRINLTASTSSNACSNTEKGYFFDTDDSQFYFKNFAVENIKQLTITFKLLHVGKDALHECLHEKDQKIDEISNELNTIYARRSWKLIKKIDNFFELFEKRG